jgi:hypothetical protein
MFTDPEKAVQEGLIRDFVHIILMDAGENSQINHIGTKIEPVLWWHHHARRLYPELVLWLQKIF